MNRHEGVSCNHCSKVNFTGNRYKCLRCVDYDLCSVCYIGNASSDGHSPKHPVQCILCKSDYALFYGGETLANSNIPQSLTCPYCARMGFTDITLKEHVTDKHHGITCQIMCPICAAAPSGDPNFMLTDLSRHLSVAHNVESRRRISFNVEEQIHPHIAGLAGNLRPRSNIQVLPAVRSIRPHAPIIVGQEPSPRVPSDPIDELIMQISRMRRMNSDNGALLERARFPTLQAMSTDINANRPQAIRQNVFVLQNDTLKVEKPEVIKQEPLPTVHGYSALLPKILKQNLSETITEETRRAHAEFVKELLYSTMCKPKDEDDMKDSDK